MKATLLTLVASLAVLVGSAQNPPVKLNIIPEPVKTTIQGDSCYMLSRGAVIITEDDLKFPAEYLAEYTYHYLGIPLQVNVPQPAKRRSKATTAVEPMAHSVRLANLNNGEIEGLFPGKYHYLPYGNYYTHEEIREVVEYAAERHITVIPEIDIPGHCMAVLTVYPHFSTAPDKVEGCAPTWGIYNRRNNVLAPSDEVFKFLEDVFSELCDLFPSPYIHLGGDECAKKWWQESEATQQYMKANGIKDEKALQSHIVHFVQHVIESKGKKAIGWDEVLEGGISKDCIIMNWRRPNFGANALNAGNRTIFTCSQWSYFNLRESRAQHEIGHRGPLSLEKVYSFDPVTDTLSVEQQQLVMGVQGCLWTEYIQNTWKAEFSLFPRMSALAENAWSQREQKNWENFSQKVVRQFDRYELWGARYNDAFLRQHDIVRAR